jgi:glycosyltransferase involved in cell wall biosynthesis
LTSGGAYDRGRYAIKPRSQLQVLHVYKDVFPPIVGGVEKQIEALREGMAPEVVSNTIVCARAPRTEVVRVRNGIEVRVAEFGPRLLSAPVAPMLPMWVARTAGDLIHVHMPNPPGEVAAILGRKGRPIVASYHADIDRQARFARGYRMLVDACLGRSSAIIAGSRRLVETSPFLRRHASKVSVIGHAVDVERYRSEAVPPELRAAIRRRYGEPLVISVGRLVYYKGYEHLIDAARTLDASLVIVGDGPERERLAELARDVPNVHLAGLLDEADLVAHLAAADCFALSSTSPAESFGIAVAEAQAMGLPAVVTDTGSGTVEAVEDGVTGTVVPPADPAALREALAALCRDEDLRRSMGAAARTRAISRHALEDRAREVRELYERVLGSSRA